MVERVGLLADLFRPTRNFPLAARRRKSYLPLTQGCGRSSGVEHNLAKVRVGRSNRLARSNFNLVVDATGSPSGGLSSFKKHPNAANNLRALVNGETL